MDNLLSYCGLTNARMSTSEKDLPLHTYIMKVQKPILNTNPPHLGALFQVYNHAKLLGRRILGDIARKHQSFHGTQMALGEFF